MVLTVLIQLYICHTCIFYLMRNNNDAKITIAVGTIAMAASLFIVTLTMTPMHAYALSRYIVDDPNPPMMSPTKKLTSQFNRMTLVMCNRHPICLLGTVTWTPTKTLKPYCHVLVKRNYRLKTE